MKRPAAVKKRLAPASTSSGTKRSRRRFWVRVLEERTILCDLPLSDSVMVLIDAVRSKFGTELQHISVAAMKLFLKKEDSNDPNKEIGTETELAMIEDGRLPESPLYLWYAATEDAVASSSRALQPCTMQQYQELIEFGSLQVSVSFCQRPLITSKVLDRGETKVQFLNACSKLAQFAGNACIDKTEVPIMATAGTGGSGKTTLLNLIRFGIDDEHWHSETLKAIQSTCPQVECLIVIMASFNQNTEIETNEEVTKALISRLFADHTNSKWESAHTARLPTEISTLKGFASWLRQKSGLGQAVALLMLVDEVAKVERNIGAEARQKLLDNLASFQQSQLKSGYVSLVFVTSLDVGTFKDLTLRSLRPVGAIRLPPMNSESGLQKCTRWLLKRHSAGAGSDMQFTIRSNITFALSASGGHFRTVEKVLNHTNFANPFPFSCNTNYPAALSLLLQLLRDPQQRLREDEEIVEGIKIHDMASANMIVYEEADFESQTLQVRLVPAALLNFREVKHFEKESTLLRNLMDRILQTSGLEKFWERSIPMAMELQARAFLRADVHPRLEHLIPGVQVGYHKGQTQLLLADIQQLDVCNKPNEIVNFDRVSKKTFSKIGCCIAAQENQAGVELSVTSFIAKTTERQDLTVTFLFQMKMWRRITNSNLKGWVQKVEMVGDKLFPDQRQKYYVVLCVSKDIVAKPPEGVIFIDADDCSKLLAPFGASPLKQLIEIKQHS